MGHLLALQMLFLDGCVRRAPAHGEVVATDHHGPAVEASAPEHEVAGDETDEVVPRVVGGLAGDLADLVEGSRVGQLLDPLADGIAAPVVLALHALGAAELVGEGFAALQFVELRLPVHR